jgi:hypothetical protein
LTEAIAVAFCTVNTANAQSNMTNASAAKTKEIATTNSSTGVTIGRQKKLTSTISDVNMAIRLAKYSSKPLIVVLT